MSGPFNWIATNRSTGRIPGKGNKFLYRKNYKALCSHVVKYVGSKAASEALISEVLYDFYRTRAFAVIL